MDDKTTNLKKWLILLNVSVAIFMGTLDGSIVNIALPVISNELHVTISSIQWVVTSYLLTVSVLLLIWGKLSDLYGKKYIFAFGFIVFTVGSAMCGFSRTLGMLVVSRILQAVGSSATMALGQGIVTRVFPANERGKALGLTGTTVAIGSLVGPSLGGILVNAAGWQSIFYINIPIGILGTLMTFAIIPKLHDTPDNKALDFRGAFLFTASLLLLFIGLLFMQEGKLSVSMFLPMLFASVILLFIFVSREKKTENPLINTQLFRSHEFSFGLGAAFLSFVGINSTLLFMPFYLQLALGLKPLPAGLLISFYPIATAAVAPISGWLSDRITYRPLTVTGMMIGTAALFLLSTLNLDSSHAEIAVLMSLLGVGTAIFQSPNNSSVMGAVPKEHLGVAGGINALFRNLGMETGTSLSVLIFSFVSRMNINNLESKASTNADLFIRGFKAVLLFAALSYLVSAGISLTRAVRTRRANDALS